jgi:hypothetical protein
MTPPAEQDVFCTKDDGYRGLWWGQSPTDDEYVYKYSGGLGTYPVQHAPFAVYCPAVGKTFFVWGGTPAEGHLHAKTRGSRWDCAPGELLHMVSFYDHRTGMVPRPTILLDKWTADPHDNPVITVDDDGHIWIFSPSHGTGTTASFIHRSVAPYNIDRFTTVSEGLFAYPQVWWTPGGGLSFFHTQYGLPGANGVERGIFFRGSADGFALTEPVCLGRLEQGHYQVTAAKEGLIATAFDFHPQEGGLEARTNIYYLQSADAGKTWTKADGTPVSLPVERRDHPSRIRDFLAEGLLVYIKDLVFDEQGFPVIHYVTSRNFKPGPGSGPHSWHVAHWNGSEWEFHHILDSDNNYDMGSLYIEPDGVWRIIGTAGKGPQAFNTGGEVEIWRSADQGKTWQRERALTAGSELNHSHPRRPVNAHPDFYAFWADGHARRPSASRLYFTDQAGSAVWTLPDKMDSGAARPQKLFSLPPPGRPSMNPKRKIEPRMDADER